MWRLTRYYSFSFSSLVYNLLEDDITLFVCAELREWVQGAREKSQSGLKTDSINLENENYITDQYL